MCLLPPPCPQNGRKQIKTTILKDTAKILFSCDSPSYYLTFLYGYIRTVCKKCLKKKILKKITVNNFLRQLTVKPRPQIIVLTFNFEMRHPTMNSMNNFLRCNIAKTKKFSVGKQNSQMQTAGATMHCRALLKTYSIFIVT